VKTENYDAPGLAADISRIKRIEQLERELAEWKEAIRERHEAGLEKYGVTVDRKDLTPDQWLQHSIEEKLDDLQYMMRLREEIARLEDRIKALVKAGDAMEEEIDNGLCLHECTVEWNYAKEVKP
jgi:uncharacterized coiled-coil DUF342 family protein